MPESAVASSEADVLATEPAIRRVINARVANPSDVDDLVQDCLERLLGVRGRLEPGTILPFGIVTARNLAISHARTAARRATAAPRIVDIREPARPEDLLLGDETRTAMKTALTRLSPQERSDILAYYQDGARLSAARLAGSAPAESPGALRVRMARTRAKLRLEYLLAFRHTELASPQCRRVLQAISAGDTRRQRELDAGQHLLDCETCAALSEPLDRRSVALTAITFPAVLAAWGLSKAKAYPLQAAASAAAGTAAVAVAVTAGPALLAAGPAPGRLQPAVSPPVSRSVSPSVSPPVSRSVSPAVAVRRPRPAPAAGVIHGLMLGGRSLDMRRPITGAIGRPAVADGVTVAAVVTRNGFWIGSGTARAWVELVGPLEPLRICVGERLGFDGRVVANGPSYPSRAGVTTRPGAALLTMQGAHLAVRTTSIRAQRQP